MENTIENCNGELQWRMQRRKEYEDEKALDSGPPKAPRARCATRIISICTTTIRAGEGDPGGDRCRWK